MTTRHVKLNRTWTVAEAKGAIVRQASALLAQRQRPRGLPAGSTGARGQRLGIALGLGKGPRPAIEGPAAHAKGLTGGCEALAGEELQNFESVVGIGGYHLPTMPDLC